MRGKNIFVEGARAEMRRRIFKSNVQRFLTQDFKMASFGGGDNSRVKVSTNYLWQISLNQLNSDLVLCSVINEGCYRCQADSIWQCLALFREET